MSGLPSRSTPSNLHELMTVNSQTVSVNVPAPRLCTHTPHDMDLRQTSVLVPDFHDFHGRGLNCFPLAPDYYLLTLIQYNVLRALMSNIELCTPADTRQAIECGSTTHITIIPPPSSIPPAFYPTALQKTVIHPFWIDSIPWPSMRDNMIRAVNGQGAKSFDVDELCGDVCGGLYEGFDDVENRGILIWGEPWQTGDWEMTEGFFRKWSWLVKGCDDLLEATNRWREHRGEDRLILEID